MPSRRTTLSRRAFQFGAAAWVGAGAVSPLAAQTSPSPIYDGPDQVDLTHLTTPVQDQGDRDSCAFFVMTALIEARIMRETGALTPLSEQFLIYVVKSNPKNEADQFTNILEVWKAAQEFGAPPESAWPYNPVSRFAPGQGCANAALEDPSSNKVYILGSNVDRACLAQDRPPQSVFDEALKRKPYSRIAFTKFWGESWQPPARNNHRINGLMDQLHRFGMPMVATVKIPANAEGWGDDGRVSVPQRLRGDTQATEACLNHFVVLTGFDRKREVFTFKNSWGDTWGKAGHGVLPFDVVSTPFIQSDFFVSRSMPRQPPG